MRRQTNNFTEAMEWSQEIFGELNVPRVWIPEVAFIEALRNGENISFTRETPEGNFGLAIGSDPIVLPKWSEFAVPQGSDDSLTRGTTFHDNWQVHAIETKSQSYEFEPLEDDEFITAFLNEHAPNSSAKPGNPEIQFWGCVRNEAGEVVAIGAVTEWESGEKLLSSVATHTNMRGQGFAQKLCAGIVGVSYDRGIDRLNLVVLSSNTAAINAYEKIGFKVLGKFASYSR